MASAKMGLLALGVIGAAACSSESVDAPKQAEGPLTIERDGALGTPRSIEAERGAGPLVLDGSSDAVTATQELFRGRPDFGLRLPKDQLKAVESAIDEYSMTHVRMQQMERGLRVTGGEVNAHYDRAGRLTSIQQRIIPGIDDLDIQPTISAATATRIALAQHPDHDVIAEPELVIHGSSVPVLAWEAKVTQGILSAWQVTIDAHSGAVIESHSMTHSLLGSGRALDGQVHPVNYSLDQNKNNVLVDQSRAVRIIMNDALGGQSKTQIITSTDPSSWDANPTSKTGAGSAVSAQIVIGEVNDTFLKLWQRRGWDGLNGDEQIFVHVGNQDNTPMDNAFYNGASNVVAIGDGQTIFKPLAGALDVLAHELGHAITGSTSKLAFGNQPGTINEHISDVFGAVVEHAVKPDPVKNWLMGEGTLRSGDAPLRDMGAPEKGLDKQPRHMTEYVQTAEDDGGVHVNNGIGNNAAFLATMGGTNAVSKITVKRGIGWDNLAKVWYRADTVYLSPNSDYAVLAKATLEAAQDLSLSKDDQDALDCAWKAVGVVQGDCVGVQAATPASTTPPAEAAEKTAPSPTKTAKKSTAGDDDDDGATTSKTTKATSAPSSALGCNTTGGSQELPAWIVGVLGAALVLGRRRRL